MKIIELYQDYAVPFVEEGHKHCRPGWVQVACPFCTGNPGYHLGYNLDEDYFHCWRCGGKFPDQVVSKLLNVSQHDAKSVIRNYGGVAFQRKKEKQVKVNLHPFKYPSNVSPLLSGHRKYLERRHFDPDKLASEWQVESTGPISMLDKVDYGKRIIFPIMWDGKVVSFQTRATSDKIEPKYMACPQAREIIEHQTILYGNPTGWQRRRGVCVEGVTDVWRLGKESFGVFGIDFTPQQVRAMTRRFDIIAVAFDPDPQAILQANKLVAELRFRGVEAFRVDIPTDPGDMSQDDADYLMRNIF